MSHTILYSIRPSISDLVQQPLNTRLPEYFNEFICKNPGSRKIGMESSNNLQIKFLFLIFFRHIEFLTNLKKDQPALFNNLQTKYFRNLKEFLQKSQSNLRESQDFNEIQNVLQKLYKNVQSITQNGIYSLEQNELLFNENLNSIVLFLEMIIEICRSIIKEMRIVNQFLQIFKTYSNLMGGHVSLCLYVDSIRRSHTYNTPDNYSLKIPILFKSNDFILFYSKYELNLVLENNDKEQVLNYIENCLKNTIYFDTFKNGIYKIDLITNHNSIFQESNADSYSCKSILLNNINRISEEISRLPLKSKKNEYSQIYSEISSFLTPSPPNTQNNFTNQNSNLNQNFEDQKYSNNNNQQLQPNLKTMNNQTFGEVYNNFQENNDSLRMGYNNINVQEAKMNQIRLEPKDMQIPIQKEKVQAQHPIFENNTQNRYPIQYEEKGKLMNPNWQHENSNIGINDYFNNVTLNKNPKFQNQINDKNSNIQGNSNLKFDDELEFKKDIQSKNNFNIPITNKNEITKQFEEIKTPMPPDNEIQMDSQQMNSLNFNLDNNIEPIPKKQESKIKCFFSTSKGHCSYIGCGQKETDLIIITCCQRMRESKFCIFCLCESFGDSKINPFSKSGSCTFCNMLYPKEELQRFNKMHENEKKLRLINPSVVVIPNKDDNLFCVNCKYSTISELIKNSCKDYLCIKCIEKIMKESKSKIHSLDEILCPCGKQIDRSILSRVNLKLFNDIADYLSELMIKNYPSNT